jgi:hypothetical protein
MSNQAGNARNVLHRLPFPNFGAGSDAAFMSANVSDRSTSATNEVENMLLGPQSARNSVPTQGGWQVPNRPQSNRPVQRGILR